MDIEGIKNRVQGLSFPNISIHFARPTSQSEPEENLACIRFVLSIINDGKRGRQIERMGGGQLINGISSSLC